MLSCESQWTFLGLFYRTPPLGGASFSISPFSNFCSCFWGSVGSYHGQGRQQCLDKQCAQLFLSALITEPCGTFCFPSYDNIKLQTVETLIVCAMCLFTPLRRNVNLIDRNWQINTIIACKINKFKKIKHKLSLSLTQKKKEYNILHQANKWIALARRELLNFLTFILFLHHKELNAM